MAKYTATQHTFANYPSSGLQIVSFTWNTWLEAMNEANQWLKDNEVMVVALENWKLDGGFRIIIWYQQAVRL